MEAFIMQIQSFCILLLMFIGLLYRRKRAIHIKIMSSAIIWDILLILQVELSRSAILKASKVTSNELLLNIHVSIAVSTVILYAFMIKSGLSLLSGNIVIRKKHKILGFTTFIMRILTFVTSFWAVAPSNGVNS